MDREKLKSKAKKLIKGNKWYLWKPLVLYTIILFVAMVIVLLPFGIIFGTEGNKFKIVTTIVYCIGGLLETAFMFGYAKYCLDFVRGKKTEWKEPFKFGLKHFVPIILIDLLFSLNIALGYVLFIIPGIIAALGLIFIQEVYADDPSLGVVEALKKAWATTKGHKMDLFILTLSFIGWAILCEFTLGILGIWLVPYMNVTFILAYESMKKNNNKKKS